VKKLLSSIPDARVRSSLAASTVDAGLWALMFGFAEYFILPFAILFGADALQTSLVSGMGQLGVAAAQLLGPPLVVLLGSRRRLARGAIFIHATSWGALYAVATLTREPWTIVALYSLGLFATSLAGPGWLSWMNDLVPPRIRGAFWGERNRVAGLAQFGAIAVGGLILRLAEPAGRTLEAFGLLFGLAALARGLCVVVLGRQHEPPLAPPEPGEEVGPRAFLRAVRGTGFGRFVAFAVLLTFSTNVMGPVFSVYLLKSLGLDYFSYTAVTMIAMVLSFLAMAYWGPLADRFGNRRILLVTAGALPLVALGWAFARTIPAMLVLQAFSGFVWAGVNLATTNYVFDSVPSRKVAGTMAGFNALSNVAAFSGSLAGGLLATAVAGLRLPFLAPGNLELVFLASALLRFLVYVFLGKGFPEPRQVERSPSLPHFYVYQPFTRIVGRFMTLPEEENEGGEAGS